VLTLFALLLDMLVSVIETRLLTWRPQQSETEPL
jgi:ABC-type nitrate/sulfonate/bicarbonate transport system permease component